MRHFRCHILEKHIDTFLIVIFIFYSFDCKINYTIKYMGKFKFVCFKIMYQTEIIVCIVGHQKGCPFQRDCTCMPHKDKEFRETEIPLNIIKAKNTSDTDLQFLKVNKL